MLSMVLFIIVKMELNVHIREFLSSVIIYSYDEIQRSYLNHILEKYLLTRAKLTKGLK